MMNDIRKQKSKKLIEIKNQKLNIKQNIKNKLIIENNKDWLKEKRENIKLKINITELWMTNGKQETKNKK